MKRLSVIITLLFVSACSNSDSAESEADVQEEAAETAVEPEDDNELNELEKENEELRQQIAKKENEKLKVKLEEKEEAETESKSSSSEETDVEAAVQEFTQEEKAAMNQMFYDWAVERAKIGGMAVTEVYFNHGASGQGDWYAVTPEGEIQVQDFNNPGFNYFGIHSIGGVAFYQPASGDFGEDAYAPVPSTAEGYSKLALPNTDIHKYMLADNGLVYELINEKEETSYTTGFGQYDNEGTYGKYPPSHSFEVSGDQAAQKEWQRILEMY